jgi:flagellar basal-body rod protein FlgC
MSGGLFGALDVSASGMTAERMRMDVIASNLANANTTRGANGRPYQRQEVVLKTAGNGGVAAGSGFTAFGGFASALSAAGGGGQGVEVAQIATDTTPGRTVYDPGNPDANAQGYVTLPNVNSVTEMTDLITATRAYEANTTAINAVKGEAQHALDVLR